MFSLAVLESQSTSLKDAPTLAPEHVHLGKANASADEKGFDRLSQVFEQVPAVTHLRRQWRALGHAIDIGATSIPADNLHSWVSLQPGDHRCDAPFW